MTARRKAVSAGLVLLLAGATCLYFFIRKRGGREIEIEEDTRPSFQVDASKPFIIQLGRGSGWEGLEIIKVDETGAVRMERIASRPVDNRYALYKEVASLRLTAALTKELAGVVNSLQLTEMGRSYSRPGIADGTQWVLWIQQSPFEKSIYFNNALPSQIHQFAERLDAIMERTGFLIASWTPAHSDGLPDTWWTPAPRRGFDLEERLLWRRIYRQDHVLPPNSRAEYRYPHE